MVCAFIWKYTVIQKPTYVSTPCISKPYIKCKLRTSSIQDILNFGFHYYIKIRLANINAHGSRKGREFVADQVPSLLYSDDTF